MRNAVNMWKNAKLVILVPLSAALFAASIIPFKAISIVPGLLELRVGNLFPIILGLLFGPAGAWGTAIGNTIADIISGTLAIQSIAGFFGNFLMAYVPYTIWYSFKLIDREDPEPYKLDNKKKVVNYILVTILGVMSGCLLIAWVVDFSKLIPFAFFLTYLIITDSIPAIVLGLAVYKLIYPRVKRWGLLWTDIMKKDLQYKNKKRSFISKFLLVTGTLFGCITGTAYGFVFGEHRFLSDGLKGFSTGTMGSIEIFLLAGFGILLILIGFLIES